MTHSLRRRVRQGIHVSLLGALACAGLPPAEAADPTQLTPRPRPIEAALDLLHWRAAETPTIVVVAERPTDLTATAEAWVRFEANGQAIPVIYVRSDTEAYHDALGRDYQALVRLAGILAHERWHLRHGLDEAGAYTAQLSAMEYLHANTVRLAEVRRALRHVNSGRKN